MAPRRPVFSPIAALGVGFGDGFNRSVQQGFPIAKLAACGYVGRAIVDRATVGEAAGVGLAIAPPAVGMTQVMAQPQLPRVAVHRRMADLTGLEQVQATADLLGTVLFLQTRDQLPLHRLRQMRAGTGGMTSLLGVTVGDRPDIGLAATIAPQLATDRTGMAADRFGDVLLRKPCALQRGDLVALLQGQVPIAHVQLHLPVKRRRLRDLARFSSRKLHFAV